MCLVNTNHRFDSPAAAFAHAIRVIGSQRAIAELMSVTQQAISLIVREGRACPAENVLTVEAATGVSRHELRPDLYPRDDAPPSGPSRDLEPVR